MNEVGVNASGAITKPTNWRQKRQIDSVLSNRRSVDVGETTEISIKPIAKTFVNLLTEPGASKARIVHQ